MELFKSQSGGFGEHLKREREMRGVSLEEIATATRISTRFLTALENEQWERLPGGVFNRGFVRAVAHYLGLDEDSLVAEYAMATNDQPQVAVWADTPAAKPKKSVRRWLVALLVVVLLAGGWAGFRELMPLVRGWREPVPAPPPVSAAPPVTAPAPPATPERLLLRVDAAKTTEITVVADGKTLFSGRLIAGEQRKFEAGEKFEISASNSTAVLLDVNGQTFLLQGAADEPGKLTITRNDVSKPSGGQD